MKFYEIATHASMCLLRYSLWNASACRFLMVKNTYKTHVFFVKSLIQQHFSGDFSGDILILYHIFTACFIVKSPLFSHHVFICFSHEITGKSHGIPTLKPGFSRPRPRAKTRSGEGVRRSGRSTRRSTSSAREADGDGGMVGVDMYG